VISVRTPRTAAAGGNARRTKPHTRRQLRLRDDDDDGDHNKNNNNASCDRVVPMHTHTHTHGRFLPVNFTLVRGSTVT